MGRTYQPKRAALDACPIEHVVAMIGGKWKARALYLLHLRPHSFAALRRALGVVSTEVLSTQLRGLIRDGLVVRTTPLAGTQPPVYLATEKGNDLVRVLLPVADWGLHELRRRGETWRPPILPP